MAKTEEDKIRPKQELEETDERRNVKQKDN